MNHNLHNNNMKGIFYMLLCSFFFSTNDAIVKYTVKQLNSDLSMFNIIFLRGISGSILIILLILWFGKINLKKLLGNSRSYIRGIFEVLATLCFFSGLMLMPMSDVYTLLNTTPLIITAVGAIFLKEKVGLRRWSAVIIGFIGVLIVINPLDLKFGYISILPIMAAIFLTLRDVITKGFNTSSNSLEIIFVTSLVVTISFGIITFFFPVSIDYQILFLIILSSVFLILGYFFSVMTIIYAPLSLTSSTRYSIIVFGIILGYLFFNEIPSKNMIIGAIIISLSGLFVIKRQKELGKIN